MKNKCPFRAWVQENAARLTSAKYNTNNGWGFGGSYGTEYLLPDGRTFVRIGTACTRHAGTYPAAYAGRYDDDKILYARLTFTEFSALDSVVNCGILAV